jgi:hypothetical protein
MNGTEWGRVTGSYNVAVIGTWALLSQSIEKNESYIRLYLYGHYPGNSSTSSAGSSFSSFGILGTELYTGSYRWYGGGNYYLLGYKDITVVHSANGTFPATSVGFWANSYHISNQEKWGTIPAGAVATIPRYAKFTKHAVSSTTTTSVSVAWTADSTCDAVQYSLNGGSWVTTSGSTYTISGLSPNTSYTVKTRIRRKDSQLWTESGSISAKTKDYGRLTSAPNFNDEQVPTIAFTNTAGYRINARLEFAGTNIRRDNISNTGSYSFNLTDAERKLLRQKCTGNSLTVRFVIATCVSGTTEAYWSYVDKTMTLINANPTFTEFAFEDVNSATLALTGNNQDVILGYSNVKVTISTANKAKSNKEATMKKYRFNSIEQAYSDTADVTITSNKVNAGEFIVYAIDSRNNSTSKTKFARNTISYKDIIKNNIVINRVDGISEQVNLKVSGKYTDVNFGAVQNGIIYSKYRFKSTETGSSWSEYIDLDVVSQNGNFSYDGEIKGDTEAFGFDINKSYQIEVLIKDNLSKAEFTAILGSGIPNLAFHKNGVSVMGKYDESVGGDFQVRGKAISGGVKVNPSDSGVKDDVWIKKGKNLLKMYEGTIGNSGRVFAMSNNSIKITGTSTTQTTIYLTNGMSAGKYAEYMKITRDNSFFIKAGKYTISAKCDVNDNIHCLLGNYGDTWSTGKSFNYKLSNAYQTFTVENDCYMTVAVYSYDTSGGTRTISNIQIEAGIIPTTFEVYKTREIYTKNDNGVYENLSSKTNSNSVFMSGNLRNLTLDDMLKNSYGEHNLVTSGWYRIARIGRWAGDYAYKPMCLLVHLASDYSYYNGSDNLISICKGGSATSIKVLNNANGSTKCISKVRISNSRNDDSYLDIYWNVGNGTNGNHLSYSIFSFNGGVDILVPTKVDDSLTVKASLDI